MLAIVLSRYDIREFDQTISLYTREAGKFEVLAKGLKKIVSKNSSNLEILSVVEVEIIKGKGTEYLGRVQPVMFFEHIYLDLDKSYAASYICQIVNKHILPGEKDETVFDLLVDFFDFLNNAEKINSYQLITAFIAKLWHQFGFSQQEGVLANWAVEDWENVNRAIISPLEQVRNYEHAHQFAEYHSGAKLAKFIKHDRIVW